MRKVETKEQIIGKYFSFTIPTFFSSRLSTITQRNYVEWDPHTCDHLHEILFSDTFMLCYHAEGVFYSRLQFLFKKLLRMMCNVSVRFPCLQHKWISNYMWIHASVGWAALKIQDFQLQQILKRRRNGRRVGGLRFEMICCAC